MNKQMQNLLKGVILTGIMLIPCITHAQEKVEKKACTPLQYAVGLGLSSTGISAQGSMLLCGDFELKAAGHYFNYSQRNYIDNIRFIYTREINLLFFSLLADYHPVSKLQAFYVSAGAYLNLGNITYNVESDGDLKIGNIEIPAKEIGELNFEFTANTMAPYLGIGYGNSVTDKKFGWKADLGAIYTGTPKVELSGSGLISPVTEQKSIIEENISWMKFYPVLSVMVYYKIR